jgi:thioredoxin reductase (NADPH)
MEQKRYDVIVIGGGPAGYTAALYATRAGLNTLVLEKFLAGEQMTETQAIDNYPGFEDGVDGFTLGEKMKQGAEKFGSATVQTEVLSVDLKSCPKQIQTDAGVFFADAVVIATGAEHRHLGVAEEESLVGRGLAYCASCDGMMYRGKTVAVVGGGNSAAADALLLSKICKKVYVIHRRDTMRAEKIYHAPLMKAENVEFKWNCTVEKLLWEGRLNGVTLQDKLTNQTENLALDGLFVSVGRSPVTSLFQGQVDLDENGYILAGEDTKTSLSGVYAAGDVRAKPFRQIITAAADGAVAAHFAQEYIDNL